MQLLLPNCNKLNCIKFGVILEITNKKNVKKRQPYILINYTSQNIWIKYHLHLKQHIIATSQ